MNSFNDTLERFRLLLHAQQDDQLQLPNDNLDTGALTSAAAYRLTDQTYAELLQRTTGKPITAALRQDLLSYYADLQKPFATKRNAKDWQNLMKELDALKSSTVAAAIAR